MQLPYLPRPRSHARIAAAITDPRPATTITTVAATAAAIATCHRGSREKYQ